ncbi:PEP-CTERM sorting domain-containing protein [Algisphaera agarilytica]|uniref:Ice-binding protein C-terminal domain-containing protein n=1 Tax=Algisphaera agarilytica TaxID=1385975 RepID=A0A7X0LK84_9BACT|nr:PEP-CTERM sorting domain-containing protein [Algisphaera agarilytica]MBB6429376.1 hypothetical protein [Algisphaera agarilytica]
MYKKSLASMLLPCVAAAGLTLTSVTSAEGSTPPVEIGPQVVDLGTPGETFTGRTIDNLSSLNGTSVDQTVTFDLIFADDESLRATNTFAVGMRFSSTRTDAFGMPSVLTESGLLYDLQLLDSSGDVISPAPPFTNGEGSSFNNESNYNGVFLNDSLSAIIFQGLRATVEFPGSEGTAEIINLEFSLGSIDQGSPLTIIPEPSSLVLLGLAGLATLNRRKRHG